MNKKTSKNRIAIVAFGSLLFNSKGLSISPFSKNGPILPLEFSRISRDKRLTLVIDVKNGSLCPTFFAISKHSDIDKVLSEFQKREHIKDKFLNVQIGVFDIKNNLWNEGFSKFPIEIKNILYNWAIQNKIDVIIFSALSRKFKDVIKVPFSSENALSYINHLKPKAQKLAIDYIKNVPENIRTNFRRYFEERYH